MDASKAPELAASGQSWKLNMNLPGGLLMVWAFVAPGGVALGIVAYTVVDAQSSRAGVGPHFAPAQYSELVSRGLGWLVLIGV